MRAMENHREFLAAQAADEIGGTNDRVDGRGEDLEHLIARRMTVTVVDGLEIVEIDEEHRSVVAFFPRRFH
jgi:hypothetical protein